MKKYAEFFGDLAMQEYELEMTFRPSVVAIACIVCARHVSKIVPEWNSEGLEELTDYIYEGEVKQCTEKLLKVYEKQFNKSASMKQENRSNRHNKENQIRKRSPSYCNRNHSGFMIKIPNNEQKQTLI